MKPIIPPTNTCCIVWHFIQYTLLYITKTTNNIKNIDINILYISFIFSSSYVLKIQYVLKTDAICA